MDIGQQFPLGCVVNRGYRVGIVVGHHLGSRTLEVEEGRKVTPWPIEVCTRIDTTQPERFPYGCQVEHIHTGQVGTVKGEMFDQGSKARLLIVDLGESGQKGVWPPSECRRIGQATAQTPLHPDRGCQQRVQMADEGKSRAVEIEDMGTNWVNTSTEELQAVVYFLLNKRGMNILRAEHIMRTMRAGK